MGFATRGGLEAEGFQGFVSVGALQREGCAQVPAIQGVYLVIRETPGDPAFAPKSVGGWFKGKDPTVSTDELRVNWVPDALVLYVGRAGSGGGAATLRSRLRQYMRFGQGEVIGHWGGRYIWQLADHRDLLVCWKTTPAADPGSVESDIIAAFKVRYGARPFANLLG